MERSKQEKILRDNNAAEYDKWYLERGENAVFVEDETILFYLSFDNNVKRFLDLGCGTGRLTCNISKKFPLIDIYGLDISPKSIEILNNKQCNVKGFEFDASIDKINQVFDKKFDRILSMQMIQHLTKDGAINAITEIYNGLTDNGIAVIELYNYTGLNRIIERIRSFGKIKKIQKKDLFFEYRYGANEFKEFCLKNSKFKTIEIYGCQNISRRWINKFPFLIKFDLWLSRFSLSKYLGYYFIAVLKK